MTTHAGEWRDDCADAPGHAEPFGNPRLERAIQRAAQAATPEALESAIAELAGTAAELQATVSDLAGSLRWTPQGPSRFAALQRIRRVFRAEGPQ